MTRKSLFIPDLLVLLVGSFSVIHVVYMLLDHVVTDGEMTSSHILEICGCATVLAGVFAAVFYLGRVFVFVYQTWLGHLLGHTIKVEEMGKWAVITGSTDGIGKAFAYEIAKRKVNVVLISLTPAKLQATAEDIKMKYGVETKTIAVDFRRGYDIYEEIKSQLEDLEIGTLINNVGMIAPSEMRYFHKIPDQNSLDMIHCNIFSVQFMTSMVLPQMVARKKGLILNIGSVCAKGIYPFVTVYSATKAFLDKQTTCLSLEYEGTGVHIQSLTTGPLTTKLNFLANQNGRRNDLFYPSPEVFVGEAMKTLGLADEITPYYLHSLWKFSVTLGLYFMPWLTSTSFKWYFLNTCVEDQKL